MAPQVAAVKVALVRKPQPRASPSVLMKDIRHEQDTKLLLQFHLGARVRVVATSRGDLNGQVGIVTEDLRETGRFTVQMGSGRSVTVNGANLEDELDAMVDIA